MDKFQKNRHTFSIECMTIGGNLGPEILNTQKVLILFVSNKKFPIFDFFLSDLEIAETFENVINYALIRSPNLRSPNVDFSEICPDPPKFQ